jgi:single-stranded DNA-specific DHH superfamily exonuclease
MPLESAAETVADQIRRQEFVEVYAHHDADGIAAGTILCHAMLRAGIRFRMRVRQEVNIAELKGDSAHLLCDLGAGIADLPDQTIVVDHHIPKFEGAFHANPRLAGIDGERELSAAGMAYIVAQKIGDNRDLAGLVMLGIIGDSQEMKGKNLEIFNGAITDGIVVPDRGLTLPGRDMTERWYMATTPYLDGISGSEQNIADFIEQSHDTAKGENKSRLDTLLSRIVLESAPNMTRASLESIYGDTYHLQREVMDDAHSLAAIIDACGKTGHGDIGVTLALRSSHYLNEAWEIARKHRLNVIDAIRNVHPAEGSSIIYEVQDITMPGDVADILTRDLMNMWPVLVFAHKGDICKISARCPAGIEKELGPLVSALASACGGNGGGHAHRAGATIPYGKMGQFTKGWQEAFAA